MLKPHYVLAYENAPLNRDNSLNLKRLRSPEHLVLRIVYAEKEQGQAFAFVFGPSSEKIGSNKPISKAVIAVI